MYELYPFSTYNEPLCNFSDSHKYICMEVI